MQGFAEKISPKSKNAPPERSNLFSKPVSLHEELNVPVYNIPVPVSNGHDDGTVTPANYSGIPASVSTAGKRRQPQQINKSSDPSEQEADRNAAEILKIPVQPGDGFAGDKRLSGNQSNKNINQGLPARSSASPASKDVPVPPVVPQVLNHPGKPLDNNTRGFMESRFGYDFSQVRVHTGSQAGESAQAVHALAYTVGPNIVFKAGQYAPETAQGKRLLAHELTHVVQQEKGVGNPASEQLSQPAVQAGNTPRQAQVPFLQKDPDDILDAGVPLPGGVVDTTAPRRPVAELSDGDLGSEYADAEQLALSGLPERKQEIEDEIEKRTGFGTAVPQGVSPGMPANTAVTPNVALKILENVSKGEPPFKPELGKGGASWFVTEGNPFTGIDPAKNIPVDVEIPKGQKPVVFKEADLAKMLEAEVKGTAAESEATFRQRFNIDGKAALNSKLRKSLARFQKQFAESRMWDKVGEAVKSSASKVGEVILEPGSNFSKSGSGKFAVVADPAKVQLKGGPGPLIDSLTKAGVSAEPPILEAAEALAKNLKWAGRVRGAFRYGGRILIVVAIAADLYKIYRAKDKVKAVVTSAGGWAGATAAGAAFAAWFTPADVAGPWAWAAHGVGTLIAGGIGYWIGSEFTRTIYELAVE